MISRHTILRVFSLALCCFVDSGTSCTSDASVSSCRACLSDTPSATKAQVVGAVASTGAVDTGRSCLYCPRSDVKDIKLRKKVRRAIIKRHGQLAPDNDVPDPDAEHGLCIDEAEHIRGGGRRDLCRHWIRSPTMTGHGRTDERTVAETCLAPSEVLEAAPTQKLGFMQRSDFLQLVAAAPDDGADHDVDDEEEPGRAAPPSEDEAAPLLHQPAEPGVAAQQRDHVFRGLLRDLVLLRRNAELDPLYFWSQFDVPSRAKTLKRVADVVIYAASAAPKVGGLVGAALGMAKAAAEHAGDGTEQQGAVAALLQRGKNAPSSSFHDVTLGDLQAIVATLNKDEAVAEMEAALEEDGVEDGHGGSGTGGGAPASEKKMMMKKKKRVRTGRASNVVALTSKASESNKAKGVRNVGHLALWATAPLTAGVTGLVSLVWGGVDLVGSAVLATTRDANLRIRLQSLLLLLLSHEFTLRRSGTPCSRHKDCHSRHQGSICRFDFAFFSLPEDGRGRCDRWLQASSGGARALGERCELHIDCASTYCALRTGLADPGISKRDEGVRRGDIVDAMAGRSDTDAWPVFALPTVWSKSGHGGGGKKELASDTRSMVRVEQCKILARTVEARAQHLQKREEAAEPEHSFEEVFDECFKWDADHFKAEWVALLSASMRGKCAAAPAPGQRSVAEGQGLQRAGAAAGVAAAAAAVRSEERQEGQAADEEEAAAVGRADQLDEEQQTMDVDGGEEEMDVDDGGEEEK